MSNVERYYKALKTAVDLQQKQYEVKELMRELSDNLTVAELKRRSFNDDDANKAFELLLNDNDIYIDESMYVSSILIYKDVNINLHIDKSSLNGSAMRCVLKDISNKDIFDAY